MGLQSGLMDLMGLLTTYGNGTAASYSMIETAVDEIPYGRGHGNVIVAKDGSLYSIIAFRGSRVMMGQSELVDSVMSLTTRLSANLRNAGHAIEINFSRNPDGSRALVASMLRTQENVARHLGMNLEYAFREQKSFMPRWITREDIYLVLWTRPGIFSKDEIKAIEAENEDAREKARAQGDLWSFVLPQAPDTQNVGKKSRRLLQRHQSFVRSIVAQSDKLGFEFELLSAKSALRAVYNSIYPDRSEGNWQAILPGDLHTTRATSETGKMMTAWHRATAEDDLSALLAPRLDAQLFTEEFEYIDGRICRIGGNLFASVDLTTAPLDIHSFPHLLHDIIRQDSDGEFPWRVSCKIEGGGLGRTTIQSALASILSITTPNGYNRNIKRSLATLRAMEEAGACIVSVRISFSTWSPVADGRQKIENRLLSLTKAVEGWGDCQVTSASGSPIASAMGTVVGLNMASTAPMGVAPLQDILYQMPWSRDVSPWGENGTCLFRCDDGGAGRAFNVEFASAMQDTFNYLVIGPPGKGKSFLLATLNYTSCLSPRMTNGFGGYGMAYIRSIDIGHSQTGMCRSIEESLPPSERHLVVHRTMHMDVSCAINPLGTPLGCRKPLPLDANAVKNILCIIATDEKGELPAHMPDMLGEMVEGIYRKYSDKEVADASPKPYSPTAAPEVHEALIRHGVDVTHCRDWLWWNVVDMLALDHADYHMAAIAQRYAVPQLSDLISFTSESLKRQYGGITVETTRIGLIETFQIRLQSAINEYPILAAPTAFDVQDARVAILDIKNICSTGTGLLAAKQNGIMYMLARYILSGEFYQKLDEIDFFDIDYRDYHYKRVQRLESMVKIMEYDEYHRTKGVEYMREQTIKDFREGRKYNIMNVLASQGADDYDKEMFDFASGIIVVGSSNAEERELLTHRLGLSSQARHHLDWSLNGPARDGSGSPFLIVLKMKDGYPHEHLLKNTPGPLMAWAFSTTAEDTALRDLLYSKMPQNDARLILAKRFPSGSAKSEIGAMTMARAKSEGAEMSGEDGEKMRESVIQTVADDLYGMWLKIKPSDR